MSFRITWYSEAKSTITQNMDYLVKEWNNKVLYPFLNEVEVALEKIKVNPQSYPLEKSTTNIHKFKINKRIVLYYRILNIKTIELVTFWNTYRNPNDLKL